MWGSPQAKKDEVCASTEEEEEKKTACTQAFGAGITSRRVFLRGVPGSWILTTRASPFPNPGPILVAPIEVFWEALAIPSVVLR